MLYLSYNQITGSYIFILKRKNNLSENWLTLVDVIEKNKIVGRSIINETIQILFKF